VAAQRLDDLVPKVADEAVTEVDSLVDNLLRSLGGQAMRPEDRPPYAGLFPEGALTQQRRRAAGGIRVFVEHLKDEIFLPADDLMDRLVRSLSSLPNRPNGTPPYESLFSFSQTTRPRQLEQWRQLAGQALEHLILNLPEPELTDKDGAIDTLLRALGGQGSRPEGRAPYQGLLPEGTVTEQRMRAAKGIRVFIEHISADRFVSSDALIDGLMRILRGLPERPAGRRPYAGLFPESSINEVTYEHLRDIAPNARDAQLRKFVGPLNVTLEEFEINTPLRQAHFLAQVAHESGEFNYVEEIASGAAYEGRSDLGNTQPGDGMRFKGRGLIQITGRFNYQDIGKALNLDLTSNPTRLADDDLAARSAGWFWNREKLNAVADKDDVRLVTRIINGGFNGLDDRVSKLAAAKRTFGI
jgi:putative chitinase